jgi:esterase/lipase superfamily enzyme
MLLYLWGLGSEAVAQAPSRSMKPSLDGASLLVRPGADLQHRSLFFATDRKIDRKALDSARRGGILVGSEDYFLNRFDPFLTYGSVDVSSPPNRAMGQENFQSNSANQNPTRHFALWDAFIAKSADELRDWIREKYKTPSLLYVHGFDNSFHDGAERLTQFTADSGQERAPILFSWPSDSFRWFRTVPGIPLTSENYKKVENIGIASERYLAQMIRELLEPSGYNVVAHSMGSKLFANAVIFSSLAQSLVPGQPSGRASGLPVPVEQENRPNLSLVAPDISTKEFVKLRAPLLTKVRRITIYCSDDVVLDWSRKTNESDDRLGFCTKPRRASETMEGVDFVRVCGSAIPNWGKHSYHLSAPEVIKDIKRTLEETSQMESLLGLPVPNRDREIGHGC